MFGARKISHVNRQQSSAFYSPVCRKQIHWRGYASSNSTSISDREVARLASKPLHKLTLADLVKSVILSCFNDLHTSEKNGQLIQVPQAWPPSPFRPSNLQIRRLRPLNPARAPGETHRGPAQPPLHRRREPAHLADPPKLHALPVHDPALDRAQDRHAAG